MEQGTVKWFDPSKGIGFIAPDFGGKDLFVHHTQIQAEGWRRLETDQRVEFTVARNAKGPTAQQVRVL